MIKKNFAIHICEGEPEIPASVTAAPCHLNKDTKPQPSEADAVLRSRAAEQAISAACGGMSDVKLARTRGEAFRRAVDRHDGCGGKDCFCERRGAI